MIRIRKYATMAAALLVLAACTTDEETAQAGGMPLGAVTVNATIGSPLTRVNTEGDGGTFAAGDIICVENLGEGKVAGRDKGYYRLQDDGMWKPWDGEAETVNSSLGVQWGEGVSNRFRGVYPATAAGGFTLPTDQSSVELLRSADYMTCEDGEPFAMPSSGIISLSFAHRMAKVTATLTFNNQYTGDEDIEAVEFCLSDGTTSVTACPTGTTAEGARTFTAILPPSVYADSSLPFCTVTIDGTTLVARVPAGGLTLAEGKAHTLNLRVGKDKLEMGTMRVNGWGSTVELEDNVAEERPVVNATTHTIRTTEEGQIADEANAGWIAEAIGTSTSLTVIGPMNEADLTAIATYLKSLSGTTIDLDLSDAKLTSIPGSAFCVSIYPEKGTESLGSVSLPRTLTSIGEYAFGCCPSIEITNWNELTSLKTIGTHAFHGSSLNGDVTIPEGVETIGEHAFIATSIESITLPSTLHSIAGNLFYSCSSLAKIVCKGNIETVGTGAFGYCGALVEIDLSACTDVPSGGSANDNIFIDLGLGLTGSTNTGGITLWVNANLVDTFKAASPWNKCKVTAAE